MTRRTYSGILIGAIGGALVGELVLAFRSSERDGFVALGAFGIGILFALWAKESRR